MWKSKHKKDAESQEVITSFDWILKSLTPWVIENMTLANINSQFNQIVDHGKNGKSQRTKGFSPDGFTGAFESLKNKYAIHGDGTGNN